MTLTSSRSRSLEELIEAHYVVSVLHVLHQEGILEDLARGGTIGEISSKRGYNADILALLVRYVRMRSATLDGSEGKLAPLDRHLLDQYVGGYGPCLTSLREIIREPESGAQFVNRSRHAAAFAIDQQYLDADLLRLIGELQPSCVADVGCGTAGLLIEIARRSPTVYCLGLDHSADAVAIARDRVVKEGLENRISIVETDSFEVGTAIDPECRDKVQIVIAVSVANACFELTQQGTIDRWLNALRAAFPNRMLIISDYYGELAQSDGISESGRRGLFHDVAQIISGQGVPPHDLNEWRAILDRNDCTLIRAFEGQEGGLRRFIFLLQL